MLVLFECRVVSVVVIFSVVVVAVCLVVVVVVVVFVVVFVFKVVVKVVAFESIILTDMAVVVSSFKWMFTFFNLVFSKKVVN